MMPGEQHALISTWVATPGPERKRAKRLSLRTAMFGLAFSRWATVRRLDQFARQRYGKRVIHLAVLAPMPPAPEVLMAGGEYVETPPDGAIRDGNLVTGFAWPAHPQFLALFLEVLGTRVSL